MTGALGRPQGQPVHSLGRDYPYPIVDLADSAEEARVRLATRVREQAG